MRRAALHRAALGLGMALSTVGSVPSVRAQTKYPGIDSVFPVAVTRGEATEVEVRTNGDVHTAYVALVEGDDVKASVVERSEERKIPNDRAVVSLEPAADAALGSRDLRLATREAITTLCRFYVTDLPAFVESSSHAELDASQPIEIPCVVNGTVGAKVETDWYRFEAHRGERVSFEVIGTRLHETIHKIGRFTPHFDAFLSVRNGDGVEVAVADDTYFADPFLSFEVPEDGTYHVVVREANYGGHPSYTYALVGRRGPVPTHTIPLAVRPGARSDVSLVGPGFETGENARATVELSHGTAPGEPALVRPVLASGEEAPELWVLPSELPLAMEIEGGDGEADAGEKSESNDTPEAAQKVALPAGIAGILAKPDDVDCYAFDAVAGRAYRFELFARRLFTPVDGVIEIVDPNGRTVASGDDSRDIVRRTSRDSEVDWTAPAEGRFVVRVRDLHSRGAADFLYHLECREAEPDFELSLDPELAMVGPGTRTPIFVRAHRRHGFDGEVELRIDGIPEGVDAFVPPIRSGMTDACVVLAVAPGTAPVAANFRITGRAILTQADGSTRTIEHRARPLVEIYQAQRVIGRSSAIAVTDASDIGVETTVEEISLAPGETKVIPVRIERGERYRSGSVSLWGDWRFGNQVFGSALPPGVSVDEKASRLAIIGEELEGAVALRAAPDAPPIARVPTVVIGLIPIEFSVFVPFSTKPIFVSVTDGKDAGVGVAANE